MHNNFTRRPAAIAAVILLAAGVSACGERTERSDTMASTDTVQPAAPATQLQSDAGAIHNAPDPSQDGRISDAVKTALAKESNLDAGNIAVTTQDGVVILSGRVPDTGKAEQAKSVAQAVPGVMGVENRIDISG